MKILKLNANQIISSNHDVLHDMHVFRIYYKICRDGGVDILPPAPVVHKNLILKYFNDEVRTEFDKFFATDREAEYFLLDGSHKTTAANLCNEKIKVMLFENDDDVEEAKAMFVRGDTFQYNLKDDMKYIIFDLLNEFKERPGFRTVEKKTLDLIENGTVLPFMVGKKE